MRRERREKDTGNGRKRKKEQKKEREIDSRPNFVIPVAEIVCTSHTKHKVCKSSVQRGRIEIRSVRQLQTVTVTRFRNCLEHLITNSSQVFRWPELRVELHAWHLTLCPFVFRAYNARVSRLMWTFLDFDAGNVAWNNSFLCTGICGKETIVLFLFFHMFDFVTRLLSFVNVVKDKILWLVRNFLIKC